MQMVKEIIEEHIIKSCKLLIRLPTLCQAPQMCTLGGPFYCYHSITTNNKLLFFKWINILIFIGLFYIKHWNSAIIG